MRWKLVSTVPAALALSAVLALAVEGERIPPVMMDLGDVVPTPLPSPEVDKRIRMITSFAVQNKPDGESIISFEATDYAKGKKDRYRILANETYSMVQTRPQHREMRDRILMKLRDLEKDLLEYVEAVGPPRDREAITNQGAPQRPR